MVSTQDLEGSIVLYLAANLGYQEINYRAKVGLGDKLSQTLLHYSTRLGYRVVTKLLVNRGQ